MLRLLNIQERILVVRLQLSIQSNVESPLVGRIHVIACAGTLVAKHELSK